MIGQISNITKYGVFVRFSEQREENFKKLEKGQDKRVGLIRWSDVPKNLPKFQIGDFIGFEIIKEYDNDKIDLKFVDKDFKSTFGAFLKASDEKIKALHVINKEIK